MRKGKIYSSEFSSWIVVFFCISFSGILCSIHSVLVFLCSIHSWFWLAQFHCWNVSLFQLLGNKWELDTSNVISVSATGRISLSLAYIFCVSRSTSRSTQFDSTDHPLCSHRLPSLLMASNEMIMVSVSFNACTSIVDCVRWNPSVKGRALSTAWCEELYRMEIKLH